jgi:cyclophilin family peptidyl-prolyl cis-trans isomerase
MKKNNRKLLWVTATIALSLITAACGQTASNNQNTNTGATQQPPAAQTPANADSTPKQWSRPPEMTIDTNKSYEAVIETTKGNIAVTLFAKDAPKTVNNFVFLSNEGFYNGIIFHRVIEKFMIQTGDPTGTGRGGPGYKFEDELNAPYNYGPGIVAMANAGPNTNGSQFFICTVDCSHLNSNKAYSIFGKVKEGMETVNAIAASKLKPGTTTPAEEVSIKTVTIQAK